MFLFGGGCRTNIDIVGSTPVCWGIQFPFPIPPPSGGNRGGGGGGVREFGVWSVTFKQGTLKMQTSP